MILFLYGDDSYRSKQKLDTIKAKYVTASMGDTNLAVTDFTNNKTNDYTSITREILALPFLAKNRLVVLKNLLSEGNKKIQEQMLYFLEKIPESTILIIYESETPDRRTALFKKLNKPKVAQEFKPLDPYQLKKWIVEEISKQNGKIEPKAVEKLILYVGNDLWRMSNEIQKLMAYCISPIGDNHTPYAISDKQVELLVKPKIESNIFGMIDAIGNKNAKQAILSLQELLENGEHELYILTMIVYQFRNLLIVKDIIESQKLSANSYQPTAFQIAKETGLNPYVVQKTVLQAKNFTMERLKEIYQKLLSYDIDIKTGKIDPRTALEILVLELAK